MTFTKLWKRYGRTGLAAMLLLLTACEAGDGPATVDQQVVPGTVNGVQLVRAQDGRRVGLAGTTVKRVSSLTGATITTEDVKFVVMPLSIKSTTTITIEPLNDGYVSFRFGPNGLQFKPPAVLTISANKADLTGIDPLDLKIAGASDSGDDREILSASVYDALTNSVTTPVSHFSRYALCVGR